MSTTPERLRPRGAATEGTHQTAVLTITPDHVVLHDFETTIPQAVADLLGR